MKEDRATGCLRLVCWHSGSSMQEAFFALNLLYTDCTLAIHYASFEGSEDKMHEPQHWASTSAH